MKKEEFQQNMKDRMQQFEDGGLRLLKKGQKGIVHAIFSRFGLVLLLMLLQAGVLWSVFRWFGGLLPHYFGGSVAMSAFMVVYILNSEMDNSAKITWMVTIAILPVVGVPLFFYVKSNIGHNALKKRVTRLTEEARGLQPQPLAAAQELAEADPGAASLARYLHGKGGGFSVYRNTEVTYFPGGEAKINEAENRLQLIFEEKPDADTRQALKSEGFKWAPSQGAWQRQLNQNAIRAAARLDFLRPEDGKSPYQLQPFAKRAEKDVSR